MGALIYNVFSGVTPIVNQPVLRNRVLDTPINQNTFQSYVMENPAKIEHPNKYGCKREDTGCILKSLKREIAPNLDLQNS
jgi:hypothetical protein